MVGNIVYVAVINFQGISDVYVCATREGAVLQLASWCQKDSVTVLPEDPNEAIAAYFADCDEDTSWAIESTWVRE